MFREFWSNHTGRKKPLLQPPQVNDIVYLRYIYLTTEEGVTVSKQKCLLATNGLLLWLQKQPKIKTHDT